MIKQVARTSTNQLKRAGGQNITGNDLLYYCFCEIRGNAGGVKPTRHTFGEVNGNFLKHPPYRKLKGIDVNRHSFFWHQNMLRHKTISLAQLIIFTIEAKRF